MINPIKLDGLWNDGYALDSYSISSEYIGEDPFGKKNFKTKYTAIGELLYKMKYNGHQDTSEQILNLATEFLDSWLQEKNIDVILPVPPTDNRFVQPTFLIAETIAQHYNIPYTNEILIKTSSLASKDMPKDAKNLNGTIQTLKKANRQCNILLIDDLFSTGTTANECVKVLKQDELINNVFFLSIVKTRK